MQERLPETDTSFAHDAPRTQQVGSARDPEARTASAPKRVVGLPRRYSVALVAARHADTAAKSVTMSIGEVVLVVPPVRDHMRANRMT